MSNANYDSSFLTQRLGNKFIAKSFLSRIQPPLPNAPFANTTSYGLLDGDYDNSIMNSVRLGQPAEIRNGAVLDPALIYPNRVPISDECTPVTIWENDFSNISDWTTETFPGHTSGNWVISTNINALPNQNFYDLSEAIVNFRPVLFPTASNGYALINSDAAGEGELQNTIIYTVSPIDLTAYTDIHLSFNQAYGFFYESPSHTYIVYSLDGAVTWNEIEINLDILNNTLNVPNISTTNTEFVELNLSTELSGQPSVHIGFKYTGAYSWFWAVDDIKLTSPC
jgi:hypothetical protein